MKLRSYYANDSISGPEVVSVGYERGRLTINVSDRGGRTLRIIFRSVVAYFVTDEGDRARLVDRLAKAAARERQSLIYEAERSDRIAWLNREAFEVWAHQPRKHYVVSTNNLVVEVVTSGEPPVVS